MQSVKERRVKMVTDEPKVEVPPSVAPAFPSWAFYEVVTMFAWEIADANEQQGIQISQVSNEFSRDGNGESPLTLRATHFLPYAQAGTICEISDGETVVRYRVRSVCCAVATCDRLDARPA